ncbi:MAG TPA: hypothetical protein VFA89_02480 [Terriglobales bacterium]|nr:hypothetical protein [Terriglobales bacterium]
MAATKTWSTGIYQGRALDLDEEDEYGLSFQHWVLNPFNYGNQYLGLLYVSKQTRDGADRMDRAAIQPGARSWRYVSRA